MRVAIIGCGAVSPIHISALREIEGVEIGAVCDRDPWRAREAAIRSGGADAYSDVAAMLRENNLQAVHILTPPDTHAELSIQAMEAGCHVLVEKPIAVSLPQVDGMIAAARNNRVKVCTNHSYLFNPSIMKARRLVENGAIGKVTYVDCFYGFAGNSYLDVKGQSHWAWNLPGGVFTNFLPHIIYLQQEFLQHIESVAGVTLVNEDRIGGQPTEMTALLRGAGATGTMVVSMRTKPYARFVNIFGTEGSIHVDLVGEVCSIHRNWRVPRMISKALFNLEESIQLAYGTAASTMNVAIGRLKSVPGTRALLREFYACIEDDREPPVSAQDGRAMVEVMEMIWAKSRPKSSRIRSVSATAERIVPKTYAEEAVAENGIPGKILVTGATGFLGHRLVAALSRCGADVRALVRDVNSVSPDLRRQAELISGDVRDPSSIKAAMRGVSVVYHCAAITTNKASWTMHNETNVLGTETVLAKALESGVQSVIHVSSVAVYGFKGSGRNGQVDESVPYAQKPDKWAHYLRSKLESDKLAMRYFRETGLPITILRLGILYGPGGRTVGRGLVQLGPVRLTVGSGRNKLPYTHLDNAVDSLLLAAIVPEAIGEAYNVVDKPQVSVREASLKKSEIAGERLILLPVPATLLALIAKLLELRGDLSGSDVPPKLSSYVIRSAHRDIQYSIEKAHEQLCWQPRVTLENGLQMILRH